MKNIFWSGALIGIVGGAVSLVKLVSILFQLGLTGIPEMIVVTYSTWIAEVQRYLIEIPFNITPPEWVKHVAVIYVVFAGTNWRFLTNKGHGEWLFTGIGDFGRGTRRGSLGKPTLISLNILSSLSGPLFTVLIFLMWLGNVKPGPGGQGRWGDHLMIGNRMYTVKICRIYLLILLAQPVAASGILLWNSIS